MHQSNKTRTAIHPAVFHFLHLDGIGTIKTCTFIGPLTYVDDKHMKENYLTHKTCSSQIKMLRRNDFRSYNTVNSQAGGITSLKSFIFKSIHSRRSRSIIPLSKETLWLLFLLIAFATEFSTAPQLNLCWHDLIIT